LARVRGEYAQAVAYHEEGLALARRSERPASEAYLLGHLARDAAVQGDEGRAVGLWQESLALERTQGNTYGVAYCQLALAALARDAGHHTAALALYADSLRLYHRLAVTEGAVACLEGVASVASATGAVEQAAMLCGIVATLREAIAAPVSASRTIAYKRAVVRARGVLGRARFQAIWAAGRALPAEQALSHGLGITAALRQALCTVYLQRGVEDTPVMVSRGADAAHTAR
jgi:hypothetical protein